MDASYSGPKRQGTVVLRGLALKEDLVAQAVGQVCRLRSPPLILFVRLLWISCPSLEAPPAEWMRFVFNAC